MRLKQFFEPAAEGLGEIDVGGQRRFVPQTKHSIHTKRLGHSRLRTAERITVGRDDDGGTRIGISARGSGKRLQTVMCKPRPDDERVPGVIGGKLSRTARDVNAQTDFDRAEDENQRNDC